MWLDERGLTHTVDIPWRDAVGLTTSSYHVLRHALPGRLYDVLDDVEDEIFQRLEGSQFSSVQEARYAERPPPRITIGLIGPQHVAAQILRLQLYRQPLRWRLDYVWALRACLDALVAREGAESEDAHGNCSPCCAENLSSNGAIRCSR